MKFKLNKSIISINDSYKSIEENNWYINFDKMGYKNGYKLDAKSKTMMTIKLYNRYYYDIEVKDVSTSVNIDGRQIATATAPFVKKEIDKMNLRRSRLAGI